MITLQDEDLAFGGAEYMMTDFMLRYSGLVEKRTFEFVRKEGQ
jgi:hypothetical protein